MRSPILFCSLMLIGANVQAGPKHFLAAVPRAVGRTAENMATFKDRSLAFHQWVLVAAIMANAGSEVNLFSRCQNCHELNSVIYGLHPSAGRQIGEELIGSMFYSTIQQAARELSYKEGSREWRGLERWIPTVA